MGAVIKNQSASVGDAREVFDPWVKMTPWRRKWPPTPVFLPGELYEQRSLVAIVPEVVNSLTQLSMCMHTCK